MAGAERRENRITRFLKETRSELRKVVWPSRREAANLTLIVLGVTVTMAVALGVIDFVFSRVFSLLFR